MHVLIVDDNAALQAVLAEVIADADNTVEVVSSADTAYPLIISHSHDVMIIDIDMHNGEGLALLNRMQSTVPPIDIPVVVIRSKNKQIPQDISMIKGHIEKPFSSSDVRREINKALAANAEANDPPQMLEEKIEETIPESKTFIQRKVPFGRSYVLFRSSPAAINDLIASFDNEGCDVLVVTTRKRKTITEWFRSDNVKALTMTVRLFGGRSSIYSLGSMIEEVDEFIRNGNRPVVAFDNLNEIINRNGMNSALTALHQMITKKYGKSVSFLVSVDPETFTAKDRGILLKQMEDFDKIGE
ncbi:regulator of RpoS [Candidatus Methanoplasma termitum]|uniref:RssB protein n=1 Tax=Candidatus Methanoplasma termitum TaxID=1577791 RepID=A0A0A7LD96_9ARCH|nr:response regulator [Candidatus Methanoplasma termitum]AIZ56287.1 regulator of RpoS [Candidatus Methanoplasma termitum]